MNIHRRIGESDIDDCIRLEDEQDDHGARQAGGMNAFLDAEDRTEQEPPWEDFEIIRMALDLMEGGLIHFPPCPMCNAGEDTASPMGRLGNIDYFRCRRCGC